MSILSNGRLRGLAGRPHDLQPGVLKGEYGASVCDLEETTRDPKIIKLTEAERRMVVASS